jgi:cytochrome c peroxidase
MYLPTPEDNPLTPAKIALGRTLFFDVRLSADRSLSCAGCHDSGKAFTDGRRVAVGIHGVAGTRNVPTLVNRGYGTSQFLDGRAASLEKQALEPIVNPKELGMTIEEVLDRLRRDPGCAGLFQAAFGREPNAEDLARALASYVRTIRSGGSPYDRYLNGDRDALSAEARRGLTLFRGKANCITCHVGPNLTDERFHNTGVAWPDGRLLDEGRFAVTGKTEERGAFKTPTLREIARTAPYMHDGSLAALEDVIDYYDRGGNRNPYLDGELRALHLTAAEKVDLAEFLRSLNGDISR